MSYSGSWTTACDPHALGGDECGEQGDRREAQQKNNDIAGDGTHPGRAENTATAENATIKLRSRVWELKVKIIQKEPCDHVLENIQRQKALELENPTPAESGSQPAAW